MTTEDKMIIDLTQPSPPPSPPERTSDVMLSMQRPEEWDTRIRAALAVLPPSDDIRMRTKFIEGLAHEYSNVASLAGHAMISKLQVDIPYLVEKCAGFLAVDDEDQFAALDVLQGMAFKDGKNPSDIDQEKWKEEWWNELGAASFPCQDYSSHKRKRLRLLDRLRSVRELTLLAYEKNRENLDVRAKELNKLSKGYQMMNELLMPDKEQRAGMMEDLYQQESEGGRHPL